MRNHVARLRVLCLLLVIVLLLNGFGGDFSWAQNDADMPIILIIDDRRLTDEQNTLAEQLAELLRIALEENQLNAIVEESHLEFGDIESLCVTQDRPILINIDPCFNEGCDLNTTFFLNMLPFDTLLTGNWIDDSLHSAIYSYIRTRDTPSQAPFFVEATLGLFSYATNDCATALPFLEHAQARAESLDAVYHARQLRFYRALCLRNQHDFHAALDVLQGIRSELTDDTGIGFFRIHLDAFIADSFAQNFDFNEALAWDNRNIEHTQAWYERIPGHTTLEQTLSDLYLLRAQHRLYLYEWDAVLEDINTALSFEYAPPHAYYYRGLTYYSQNEGNTRELAYADFVRYLELETDANSPLIAQAERFVETLENTLSTESGGQ